MARDWGMAGHFRCRSKCVKRTRCVRQPALMAIVVGPTSGVGEITAPPRRCGVPSVSATGRVSTLLPCALVSHHCRCRGLLLPSAPAAL